MQPYDQHAWMLQQHQMRQQQTQILHDQQIADLIAKQKSLNSENEQIQQSRLNSWKANQQQAFDTYRKEQDERALEIQHQHDAEIAHAHQIAKVA